MIVLSTDCLIFQTANGESIPYTAENISVHVVGSSAADFDTELVRHAAAAVFHYFRDELRRESVSVGEFTLALEKVLRGFSLSVTVAEPGSVSRVTHTNLDDLAGESGRGGELFFFPRLRDELRNNLRGSPQMVCFQNVRGCVKRLTGLQRWNHRCQNMQDNIVEFLRSCITTDSQGVHCSLVVK